MKFRVTLWRTRMVARRLAIIGCAVLAGCASGLNRPADEVTATTGPDHVQHITITTHSFYFEPNRLRVTRGIPVDLTVKNGAFLVPHDFSCEAKSAGIDIDLRVGLFHGSKHVRFTPTLAGTYPFHCDVDSHARKGMMGALIVTEP